MVISVSSDGSIKIQEKNILDSYLTPYTKVNSRLILDLSVEDKNNNALRGKIIEIHFF